MSWYEVVEAVCSTGEGVWATARGGCGTVVGASIVSVETSVFVGSMLVSSKVEGCHAEDTHRFDLLCVEWFYYGCLAAGVASRGGFRLDVGVVGSVGCC